MSATTNLGRVSIVPKGAYSASVQYKRLDLVTEAGSSYVAKQPVRGVKPPNATYWQPVADISAAVQEMEGATADSIAEMEQRTAAAIEEAQETANQAVADMEQETGNAVAAMQTATDNATQAMQTATGAAVTAMQEATAEAVEAANAATAAANVAEAARANEEAERVEAENARVQAEAQRQADMETLTIRKADAITLSASGTLVHVDDSAEYPIQGLTVYGRSTQDGTPTPENPVEIVSVGDGGSLDMICSNQNLLRPNPLKNYVNNGVTINYEEDGRVTFEGTVTGAYAVGKPYSTITLPAGVYYLCCNAPTIKTGITAREYETGITYEFASGDNIKKITLNKKTNVKFAIQSGSYVGDGTETLSVEFYPVLAAVASDTEQIAPTYNTVTLSGIEPLRGIPVSSGGNVTIDGQQYIADTLTVKADGTGEVVRRIKKYELKPNYNWKLQSLKTNNNALANFVYESGLSGDLLSIDNIGICNRFKHQNSLIANETEQGFQLSNNETPTVRIYQATVNTVEGFKTWLNENPTYILYPLKMPTTEQLLPTQVQKLLSLSTYKPVSNIYTPDGALLDVTYIADTKTYVDKLATRIAALEAAAVTE